MKAKRICGGILLLANNVFAQCTLSGIMGYGTIPLGGYSPFASVYIDSETIGWSFTASQNLEVTALGCAPGAWPSTNEIEVGLWAGNGALLASASVEVAFGTGFTPVNPVMLQAGNSYVVGAWGGNLVLVFTLPLEPILAPQIHPVDSALSSQSAFAFPTSMGPASGGQGTTLPMANFQFDFVPSVNSHSPQLSGTNLLFSFPSSTNDYYVVWSSANLAATNWIESSVFVGTGSSIPVSLPIANDIPQQFYRVERN